MFSSKIFCRKLMWQYFKLGKLFRKRPGEAEKFPSSERFIYALETSTNEHPICCTQFLYFSGDVIRRAAQTPPDAGHSFLRRRGTAGAFCRQCRLLMLPPAPQQQSNEIVNVICVLEFQDCGHVQDTGATALKPAILQGILQKFRCCQLEWQSSEIEKHSFVSIYFFWRNFDREAYEGGIDEELLKNCKRIPEAFHFPHRIFF